MNVAKTVIDEMIWNVLKNWGTFKTFTKKMEQTISTYYGLATGTAFIF